MSNDGRLTMKAITPATIAPPFARYSHAIETPPGARLLVLSGQLGIYPDLAVPAGAGAQAARAFANIEAVVREVGLGRAAIVRVNAYVTDRADMPAYMAARDAFFADVDPPPASTLMIVSGFTRPEFLVEIEALAAAP
jgi:2-iminobutanoate/2-iminopropanoate deaminase